MKKVYLTPAIEIEKAEMAQNLMLTVSVDQPFADGEVGKADADLRNDLSDIELW